MGPQLARDKVEYGGLPSAVRANYRMNNSLSNLTTKGFHGMNPAKALAKVCDLKNCVQDSSPPAQSWLIPTDGMHKVLSRLEDGLPDNPILPQVI
jgi:hypothetical protein